MESNRRQKVTQTNKNIINQLSNFFAGFGIDFPVEEMDYDREYEIFRENYMSNFQSPNDNNIDIMSLIKTLFEENKKSSLNKKQLRKFLLTKNFCKKVEGKFELPSCCICISDIKLKEKVILISCGHLYHDKCIIEWLRKSKNCPTCRFNISI
jgi:hypothetical protein